MQYKLIARANQCYQIEYLTWLIHSAFSSPPQTYLHANLSRRRFFSVIRQIYIYRYILIKVACGFEKFVKNDNKVVNYVFTADIYSNYNARLM